MSVTAEYFVGLEVSSNQTCPFQLDISFLDRNEWPLWRDGETVCYPDFPLGSDRIGGIIFGAWQFGDGTGIGGGGNPGPGDLAFLYDLTDRTRRFAVQRGRDTNLDSTSMGQAEIIISDPSGEMNPLNPDSPFWPTIRPGKRAAILMKHSDDWEGIFYGIIRDIEYRPNDYETSITLVDDFYRLSRVDPKIPAVADDRVGEIMTTLAEYAGLTNDNLRQFDDGPLVKQFVATGDKSALGHIQELLDMYRGAFFVDRNGVLRWIDVVQFASEFGSESWLPDKNNESILDFSPNHHSLRTRSTPVDLGVLLASKRMTSSPSASLDNLRNEIVVKADVGGSQSEQRVSDPDSIALYGVLTASYDVNGAFVYDPQQLVDLAEYLLGLWRGLNPPIRSLTYIANEGVELMTATEVIDVGSLAHLVGTAGDVDEYMVQSVTHRVDLGAFVHEVALTLSRTIGEDVDPTAFSTLGRGLETV